MGKKRDLRLDVLRGLLMMLVVMGHCIQYVAAPTDFDHNIIFRLIYSFHMPAFMCLSGYVTHLVHPHCTCKQLGKRISSLLVPFLVWGIFSTMKDGIPYWSIFLYPERGLWFLWVLAEINVLVFLIEKIPATLKYAGYVCVYILLLMIPWNTFGVGQVRMYFLWFALGVVGPVFWKPFPHKAAIRAAGLIGWPVAALFWMRNEDPLFANMFHLVGMEARAFHYFCSVYRLYLTPLLGIVFIWTVSRAVWKYLPVKLLQTVGENTIAIYAMQYYCWIRAFPIPFVNVVASFILAILLPVLFVRVISKWRLLAFLFLGKKPNC